MKKEIAKELYDFVKVVEERFSRVDRQMNFNNESFAVQKIIHTSDHSASVIFTKIQGNVV